MLDLNEFKGKIAIVTGAAQGIGKAVADLLLHAGAKVAAIDIKFTENKPSEYPVDISHFSSLNNVIDDIEVDLGPVDFLVNAAGILRTGELSNFCDDEWNETFAVNTYGAFNTCRAVAQKMIRRKRGAIVVIGSNASKTPRFGMGAYAASKAATEQMVKCLGLELAEYNIRCNIVAPGSTNTEMQKKFWNNDTGINEIINGSLKKHRLGIPLKRIATPEDVANAVLFMLSSASAHITLETLVIDGGATLG